MTLVLGANCIDGVVLVADRKVIHEDDGKVEYTDKLFNDYFPTVIGAAGSEILYTKFRPLAVEAARQLSGRLSSRNTSGEVRMYSSGVDEKAILIPKYLKSLEDIVYKINTEYKGRVGESFELLFAVQTSDGGARLNYISERGVAQDIYDYKVIGSAKILTRTFLKQLWQKQMTMHEFAQIAYFIIKFIEYQGLDDKVGVGSRKPQVWKIPNTGQFELNTDESLGGLESETHERRIKHAQFMTELFAAQPLTDNLGYVKRGAENTTFRLETFVENVGQTGQTIRKIRLLHPDRMIERCKILFDGTPLVWDKVSNTSKTIEAGGGGNVVVPDSLFKECADVVVESAGDVIRKVNYKDLEMVSP